MLAHETIQDVRILLAEDDEIMRITLSDRLNKNGWKVDEAEDGKKALECIKKNNYQIVLSDIRMPGLDGQQGDQGPQGERDHLRPGDVTHI